MSPTTPELYNTKSYYRLMHQSIPPAPSPPPLGYYGAFARLVSPGGAGICKFCTTRGPGICQPPGHSRAFDTQAVSYQNITTQKVLLGKKSRLAHLSRTELHINIGAIDVNQSFLVIKFLLILFKEHPFTFTKLFITYNFTALY